MAAKTTKSAKTTSSAKKAGPRKTLKKDAKAETNLVRRVTHRAPNKEIPAFSSGDSVNVFVKIKEGEKERTQIFKGVVIKVQGSGMSRSFTVRKISAGVGVERTFPFASPVVEKVEVLTHGKVRRSRLFYLRGLSGKAAKINSDLVAELGAAEEVPAET